MTTSMKNILLREMDHRRVRPAHESHKFPGHEQRLAEHTRRIRSATCECSSGKPYDECCIEHNCQRSSAQVSYSLHRSVHPDLTVRWKIEDRLRIRAFNAFYRADCDELDPVIRFVRALLASARRIRDHRQISHWLGRFHSRICTKTEGDR